MKIQRYVNVREVCAAVVYGVAAALAYCLGETSGLSRGGVPAKQSFAFFPLFWLATTLFVLGIIFAFKKDCWGNRPILLCHAKRRVVFISTCIICGLWLITFCACYPGCVSSDSFSSMRMALGQEELSSHHPIAFTMLVWPFVAIGQAAGDMSIGIALYSLVSLGVVGFVCSQVIWRIYSRSGSALAMAAAVCFFALNPILARFAITMGKDVPFSVCIVLFVMAIGDLARKEKGNFCWRDFAPLFFFGLGVLLFRSNGPMVFVLSVIFLLFAAKGTRKSILATAVACVCVYILLIGPISSLVGVKPASFRETVGIPIQQIARTVVEEGYFCDEDERYLSELFSAEEIRSKYDPAIVDPVKWADSFDAELLEKTKPRFAEVWLHGLIDNWKIYFKAWRDLTVGYWHAGVENYNVVASAFFDHPAAEQNGSERYFSEPLAAVRGTDAIDVVKHFPLFAFTYNNGLLAWTVLLALTVSFARKDRWAAAAIMPLISIWLGMLFAAPVYCEFRYVLAIHLGLPLIILAIIGLWPGKIQV